MNTLMFHGYKVVANPLLTKTETCEIIRTWKERLFTRPWQPFKLTSTESYQVPDRNVLVDKANRVMYAHPDVVKEIEAAIEKSEPKFQALQTFGFSPTVRVDPLWRGPIA